MVSTIYDIAGCQLQELLLICRICFVALFDVLTRSLGSKVKAEKNKFFKCWNGKLDQDKKKSAMTLRRTNS